MLLDYCSQGSLKLCKKSEMASNIKNKECRPTWLLRIKTTNLSLGKFRSYMVSLHRVKPQASLALGIDRLSRNVFMPLVLGQRRIAMHVWKEPMATGGRENVSTATAGDNASSHILVSYIG
jgi:hypothetical protein